MKPCLLMALSLVLALLSASCSCPRPVVPHPRIQAGAGKTHPSGSQTVWVDPRMEDVSTGMSVQSGRWYLFRATSALDADGRRYADASQIFSPATPDGSYGVIPSLFNVLLRDVSSKSRPHDRLRVRRDGSGVRSRFMTLMGCIGPSTSHADLEKASFIIGSSRVWQAPCDGKLHVFVNDWPNNSSTSSLFRSTPYSNNLGGIVLTIVPLPQACTPVHQPR